jgi:hypothetical protein
MVLEIFIARAGGGFSADFGIFQAPPTFLKTAIKGGDTGCIIDLSD